MLRVGLYDRLSDDEKEVLRQYEERVAQCKEKLRGGESDLLRETMTDRPATTLPTRELVQVPGFPGSTVFTVESEQLDAPLLSCKQYSTPKHSSFRSSRSGSSKGTPRRGMYAEPTYNSRVRSKSPKEDRGKKPGRKRLDLRLVQNLEAEVGKMLRIVYRYAKQERNLKTVLCSESKLFRLYWSEKHPEK